MAKKNIINDITIILKYIKKLKRKGKFYQNYEGIFNVKDIITEIEIKDNIINILKHKNKYKKEVKVVSLY